MIAKAKRHCADKMNISMHENQEREPTAAHLHPVPALCSHLAKLRGYERFAIEIKETRDITDTCTQKEKFEKIVHIGKNLGIRTYIYRPDLKDINSFISILPVMIESRTDQYSLLTRIEHEDNRLVASLMKFDNDLDQFYSENIPLETLKDIWTGQTLHFEKINTALMCFSLVAREHNLEVTQERIRHEYGLTHNEIEPNLFIRLCKDNGLKARYLKSRWDEITQLKKAYPAIARLKSGTHCIITGVTTATEKKECTILYYDPMMGVKGSHEKMGRTEFEKIWNGEIYVIKRPFQISDESQPFSLRWFIPEILKQRTAFFDVALAVLFIHVIALITPIFFQIVIDKVLVNQAFTTLHVLGTGMVFALVINACLDFLRDYILLHATNKIDMRITARTFRHMLNLPLNFFEKITAGVLTKHMQQTASIRSFLTGSVFLTMLEATSLFVFLPFLFFYSGKLTAIVIGFTGTIAVVILSLIGPFKRRLNALYDAEGYRQAMLVETINGMPTVKAMAIEPKLRMQWEDRVAKAISMQFRVGKISITAKSLTHLLEKLLTIVVIWVGAGFVFNNQITVGALIAFQMLAGRVTSPLVRLVGLVHQYQEAALSVKKLSVVMNTKEEWGTEKHGARISLKGAIKFDRVSFRYAPDLPNVLQEISFNVPNGTTLGIVGPSGSGKTTLTKMLQKFYFPSAGTIKISNYFLNEIDTAHLRQNMGVVLQENFLFRETVAENIRSGQSSATRQQIIEAAVLAGADEFIVNLSQGYDTFLEEGATNLSGGQRQRLAIARALLTRPDILVLDEATSALDPESERIVRNNLSKIAAGRTVIIVSHRLSMLKNADNILVLDKGRSIGWGNHQGLLKTCNLYSTLWEQQMG